MENTIRGAALLTHLMRRLRRVLSSSPESTPAGDVMTRKDIDSPWQGLAWDLIIKITVLTICYSLLMLVPAGYMLVVYEQVLANRSTEMLGLVTVVVILLFVVMLPVASIRSIGANQLGEQWATQLQHQIHRAAPVEVERQQLVKSMEAVRRFFAAPVSMAMADLPALLVFIGVLFMIHPLLSLFAVVVVLILCGLHALKLWLTCEEEQAVQRLQTKHSRSLEQAAQPNTPGSAAQTRQQESDRFAELLAGQRQAHERRTVLGELYKGVRLLSVSLILGLGAWLVLRQSIGAGQMIMASILLGRMLVPLDTLFGGWQTFVAARAGWCQLEMALPQVTGMASRSLKKPKTTDGLQVKNLVLGSRQGGMVLQVPRLQVPQGKILAVSGPSSSGKSYLASVLAGCVLPGHGEVLFGQVPVKELVASAVGWLPPEEDRPLKTSIATYLLGCEVTAADVLQVQKAAERFAIHQRIDRLAEGYDTPLSSQEVSTGLWQLIRLCRVFLSNPQLLVLDGPDVHLDQEGHERLQAALAEVKGRGGVVVMIIDEQSPLRTVADVTLYVREATLTS